MLRVNTGDRYEAWPWLSQIVTQTQFTAHRRAADHLIGHNLYPRIKCEEMSFKSSNRFQCLIGVQLFHHTHAFARAHTYTLASIDQPAGRSMSWPAAHNSFISGGCSRSTDGTVQVPAGFMWWNSHSAALSRFQMWLQYDLLSFRHVTAKYCRRNGIHFSKPIVTLLPVWIRTFPFCCLWVCCRYFYPPFPVCWV